MAEIPICEATVIRPGDHLIVRVEDNLTMADADEIKLRLQERLPLLGGVTIVRANGLCVFRPECEDDGRSEDDLAKRRAQIEALREQDVLPEQRNG